MISKVFFDTNVIIDAITSKDNDYADSQKLIIKVAKNEIEGMICAKQITDIYYILRKYVSSEFERRNIIKYVCSTFKILPLFPADIKFCINSNLTDFEDAVINEVAKVNCANYLVTHDSKHFKNSNLSILTPNELLTLIETND